MATSFHHTYNDTELTNYWILQDAQRDRQTSWTILQFWEKDLT